MKEAFRGKLEVKIAVITGGNSGLGLAAAERFVAEEITFSSPGDTGPNWMQR
jgi:NADP-dependent 3-hydroxy acid dehydrogenase YdfG